MLPSEVQVSGTTDWSKTIGHFEHFELACNSRQLNQANRNFELVIKAACTFYGNSSVSAAVW
jgi:hypothetical protein